MSLAKLYLELADVLDGDLAIEQDAKALLRETAHQAAIGTGKVALPDEFAKVMQQGDALPVCQTILTTPFRWAPPQTSTDPKYVATGAAKVHVELVGPKGLAPSEDMRIGLYGIRPHSEYGVRTHPAEEVFVMLAGQAFWKRGGDAYNLHGPGARSYHPSMLQHATKTGDQAFMSIYVWRGDISTENYVYLGAPT